MVTIRETPVQIGRGQGLSAMLTHPADPDPSRPVFVMLNAGLLHRVGPFRLHVALARELARLGYPALRLDLSGLGYSPRHPEYREFEAVRDDVDTVFTWLREAHSLERPVLFGSCSGADLAHRVAVADERVKGCVFLDGYAYQNTHSVVSYYAARVHRPEIWRDWLQSRLGPAPEHSEPEAEDDFWESDWPSLEQFRSELAVLLERATPLLYVYSGSVREYNYENQFFDVCPEARKGPVTVRYDARANHTYMLERDRRVLVEAIGGWAAEAFD
jgi:pimeloyl-ACP methyl ester carboxylesterase